MNTGVATTPPVRGTQTMVDQMGWVWKRPLLSLLEIAWRWTIGIPFLLLAQMQMNHVFSVLPLELSGWNEVNGQNPWVAVRQIDLIVDKYEPIVYSAYHWLLPLAVLAWIVFSGIGRALVLKAMEPGAKFRPIPVIVAQAVWVAQLTVMLWFWFRVMQWVALTHIQQPVEPELVGFAQWLIFFSLGVFSLWAIISWPAAVAPVLVLKEGRGVFSALVASLKLGKKFTNQLLEIGLVMGIVKLALIVLTMVFSAAPLPFSDQLGPEALHVVTMGALVFFLVASDYFHVVRLKAMVEFWRTYRSQEQAAKG
ncbi:MAG: hypothetical protein KGN79_01670 [Acidobacteriota bacterium]|nr:hypothetical protein [Acidobacteriota bacterium]